MNENKSLEFLQNILSRNGLKGNFKKGIYLNHFIMKKGIVFAVSWELNRIIILNTLNRKIIKQIQLQNVLEIRIISSRFSLHTTHNKILFVKDIHLNYQIMSEIDIDFQKYSIFPLLKDQFCIFFKNTQEIKMYKKSNQIASMNAKHKQNISMIWPLQNHTELIAVYDQQDVEVMNWKLNQIIFRVENLKLQNPKKSVMCSLDTNQYLICSQSGIDILNILEYDGYPKKEYWPRPCQNAQFISIVYVDKQYIIGSFLNEYQDYFLYVLDKQSQQYFLKQVISDYYLTQITNKSFLITFSHDYCTKFLIWQ